MPVSIVLDREPRITAQFLEEFPKGHRDTVDDEHCVSSVDKLSVEENHTGFRGHAASMRPGS